MDMQWIARPEHTRLIVSVQKITHARQQKLNRVRRDIHKNPLESIRRVAITFDACIGGTAHKKQNWKLTVDFQIRLHRAKISWD